jgi:hypothetical protein
MGAAGSARPAGPLLELIASPRTTSGAGSPSARSRRAAWALAALLALLAAAPATAGATQASRAELATLADRAANGDAAALRQLREVDTVDGRPYAVEDALAGAEGEELEARLREIASLAPHGEAGRPDAARGQADEILSDNRYEGSDLPRPFKGVLDWIGERLDPVRDWIETAFEDVADVTPGGDATLWSITAALLLLVLFTLGQRTLRDRAAEGAEARAMAARPERETPESLERAADRAERDGDLEAAVRLRFRAGLLRLDARQAITFRPSIATREVSRALDSPEFDQLAALFDGVVYGGEEATPEDVERSRRGWDAVLREVRR